jgi:hypothetical protein
MALWTKLKPEWEEEVRQKLESNRQWLFGDEGGRLLTALRTKLPGLTKAYVVNHVPEQGEDFYTVVVGSDLIAFVEVDRLSSGTEPIVELQSVREYHELHRKLGRDLRENLEVAIQLMHE